MTDHIDRGLDLAIPRAGDGVTLLTHGKERPGTILRVSTSGRCLWFQVDCVVSEDGDGTAARFVPDPSAWIYRAIRQPDGVYREDHDMNKVLVGVRRFRERRNVLEGEPGKRTLAQLEDAVERLEPWLLKTRWYPMTNMAIPSLLRQADEIIAELAAFPARDEAEQARARALGEQLSALRKGFKRRV